MRCVPALLLAVSLLPARAHAESLSGHLNLAVATNLVPCTERLNEAFVAQHPGSALKLTGGESSGLAQQSKDGAGFEVLLTTDLVPQPGARLFAYDRLALWTNTPGINPGRGRTVFVAPSTTRIAIAQSATSPYGRAAQESIEKLGVPETVKEKFLVAESLGALTESVRDRTAEIGLVPYSLLIAPPLKGVGLYVVLPGGSYTPIAQTAVLTPKGATNPLAKDYLDFLASDAAKAIIEDSGYALPDSETGSAKAG